MKTYRDFSPSPLETYSASPHFAMKIYGSTP